MSEINKALHYWRPKWHRQYSQAYNTGVIDVKNVVTYLLTDVNIYSLYLLWKFVLINE